MGSVERLVEHLVSFMAEDVYLMSLHANAFLWSVADVALGRVILEKAGAAQGALKRIYPSHLDFAFYTGKIHAARFLVANNHSRVHAREAVMQIKDKSCLEIPEGSF